jgi:hypothetical protein
MPRALYDYCRLPDGDPVVWSRDVIIQSGRQLQHPLLCHDCEGLLSRNGENWVLPRLATNEGAFPFFDILKKVPPDVVEGGSGMYAAARNPEMDTTSLTHFAMGIFWKASVHSWRANDTAPLIDLGEYGESVRSFLLAQPAFPEEMVLIVGVSPPPVEMTAFCYPYRGSEPDYQNFLFYVPGIEFALLVGRGIPAEKKQCCFASHPLRPILASDLSEALKAVFQSTVKNAHRAKNVTRYLPKGDG